MGGYWGARCNFADSLGKRFHQACKVSVETAVQGAAAVSELCTQIFKETVKKCLLAELPLDEIPVGPEVFCAALSVTTWLTCSHYGKKALMESGLSKIEDSACGTKTWYPEWA